ncbi:MAG: hypothetical protein PVI26_14770 [Chitinispirillia bacterium]|jgi:cell division protein FtsL
MRRTRKRRKKFEFKKILYTELKRLSIVNHYIIALIVIASIVIIPLLLVWKQVYITNASVHTNSLKESLDVLNREIAELNILAEQLSCSERIEGIARNSIGLDYPKFEEIIFIRSVNKKKRKIVFNPPFWAVLRRSIGSEKG